MRSFSLSALAAGLLSAFVGFASSFAIVVQGLVGVGASAAEAASGLMAASVAMGLCGIFLSLRHRMPISAAWSTPGAALLGASADIDGGFSAAVGAFLVSAGLVVIAGLWQTFGRLVSAIPVALAQAMLAGVLLAFCLAPFEAAATMPLFGIPILVIWFVVGRFSKLMAMPSAVLLTFLLIIFGTDMPGFDTLDVWTAPVLVTPAFSVASLIGIALPLFVVTMASQNIPGIAVLDSFGYHPKPGPLFSWTGVFSAISAPFGAHATNLAAITAALCANEDAHPDPSRRYWSAVVAGLAYVMFGIFAAAAVSFIEVSPPLLIRAVAGLALIGAFMGALKGSLDDDAAREAAVITFLITASGVTFLGVGGAFWGLLVGGVVYAVKK